MDTEARVSISRRAVLAAAAGGSAVVVAKTVLGPRPLVAAEGPGDGLGAVYAVNRAVIPAGARQVTIEPGVYIPPQSTVVCSLLSDPGSESSRTIQYVEVDPDGQWYTVHMKGPAQIDLTIGCAVLVGPSGPASPPSSPPISPPISGAATRPS